MKENLTATRSVHYNGKRDDQRKGKLLEGHSKENSKVVKDKMKDNDLEGRFVCFSWPIRNGGQEEGRTKAYLLVSGLS